MYAGTTGDANRAARPLVVLTLIVLAGFVLFSAHRSEALAAEEKIVTWGAVDPTWSPDGSRLAFSLFGSIWEVAPNGGEASQLTDSPGYQVHPAWSPLGDKMAFVRGTPPGTGELPKVSGSLVVADVASGQEREVKTPFPLAGTIAWSPDGTRFACPLRGANGSVVIYEVGVANGAVRPLQMANTSNWVYLTWNPKTNEIVFAADRFFRLIRKAQRNSGPCRPPIRRS